MHCHNFLRVLKHDMFVIELVCFVLCVYYLSLFKTHTDSQTSLQLCIIMYKMCLSSLTGRSCNDVAAKLKLHDRSC